MIPVQIGQNQEKIKRSEIESLVSLLEDPDHFINDEAKNRLLQLGEKVIPVLDEYRCHLKNEELKQQIKDIIQQISIGSIEQEFIYFLEQGVETIEALEQGVFILSKLDCPTLQTEVYRQQLDQIAERIHPHIQNCSTKQACNFTLNFIFETEKFQPTTHDYFDPVNSYFHRVLKRRRGIPITLAMVVLFVGRRLNLPFEGVNMPMHFLLRYTPNEHSEPVYIDPFNSGTEVCLEQCIYFLKKCGIRPGRNHFEPAQPIDMLARTLRNFINSYEKQQHPRKAKEFKNMLELLEISQQGLDM